MICLVSVSNIFGATCEYSELAGILLRSVGIASPSEPRLLFLSTKVTLPSPLVIPSMIMPGSATVDLSPTCIFAFDSDHCLFTANLMAWLAIGLPFWSVAR